MTKLAADGGNYGRLWMGYPEGLEVSQRGEYRLDIAWKFDQIMKLSEEHGIYQKICIDTSGTSHREASAAKRSIRKTMAYSVEQWRPIRNMRDFFLLPEARRMFKNRLRYLGRSLGL